MIWFCNNGALSLIDIMTMGDSQKRGDDTKIGKFDSGLKYAIAILYRNGIETKIQSKGLEFSFSTSVVSDEYSDKKKELLVVNYDDGEAKSKVMSFSPNLGHEWKTWMAIRELYSNCVDEGGSVFFEEGDFSEYDTVISVSGSELLQDIIDRWDSFFISDSEDPISDSMGVKIYLNNEEFLKLYKNGILIFEDANVKSSFCYDYESAKIDEMRVLSDKNDLVNSVCSSVQYSTSEDFINAFIDKCKDNTFESAFNYYSSFSQTWVDIVNTKYKEGNLNLPKDILTEMSEDHRFEIAQRRLSYDPSCSWAKTTVVVSEDVDIEEDISFEDSVKRICSQCNFDVKYPIVKSSISKYRCIPDMRKKCLYITEDFSKEDLWEVIKAVFRIDGNDDTNYVYKKYAEHISK